MLTQGTTEYQGSNTEIEFQGDNPNLKTLSTKVILQHANNRSTLIVAYGIKNFINFTGMMYFNLRGKKEYCQQNQPQLSIMKVKKSTPTTKSQSQLLKWVPKFKLKICSNIASIFHSRAISKVRLGWVPGQQRFVTPSAKVQSLPTQK